MYDDGGGTTVNIYMSHYYSMIPTYIELEHAQLKVQSLLYE